MTCTYCSFSNSAEDHRCRRCGRRINRSVVSGPGEYVTPVQFASRTRNLGATALSPIVSPSLVPEAKIVDSFGTSQPLLFPKSPVSKVVPITRDTEPLEKPAKLRSNTPRTSATRRTPHPNQSTLDFLPIAPQSARTLKTTVEAVIYCDAPVATSMHRFVAAALDSSMIGIGCGIFLTIFNLGGGGVIWNRLSLGMCAAALILVALLYGLLFALCGRETAGMRWTELQLINFDGFPPDARSRAIRLVGTWLSFGSGTIGLLWALVDEESLTWHDHMSKTFPTVRESHGIFVRQR